MSVNCISRWCLLWWVGDVYAADWQPLILLLPCGESSQYHPIYNNQPSLIYYLSIIHEYSSTNPYILSFHYLSIFTKPVYLIFNCFIYISNLHYVISFHYLSSHIRNHPHTLCVTKIIDYTCYFIAPRLIF